ncbi:MAG: Ig-like domain repeat protein, partial [Thaumarchaeota archaeon]|nr:Ig-like domain repeat protein [Nitrososphaerota archaeon]
YGTITNSGTIINAFCAFSGGGFPEGIIANLGTITNNNGGVISNAASIIDGNDLNGNYGNGIINNDGVINNDIPNGSIYNNQGTINNNSGGVIYNHFHISFGGTVLNSGIIDNLGNVTQVVMRNQITVDIDGTLTNSGTISNYGALSIDSHGTISNSGTINNYYVITNSAILTNNGNLNEFCGGSLSNNPPTGTAPTMKCSFTTTSVSSSQNPSAVGKSVLFTVSVSPSTASGTVQFYQPATSISATLQGTPLGSGTLSDGKASLSITSLGVGQNPLVAYYSGDTTDGPSISSIITQTVIAHSPETINGSYNVNENTPSQLALGHRQDIDNVSNCTYSIVTNPLHGALSAFNPTTGSVTYTPNKDYTGIDSFSYVASFESLQGSVGTFNLTIQPYRSTPDPTSLSITPNPARTYQGSQIAFTATLTDTSNSPLVPTGAISWSDNGTGGAFGQPICTTQNNNALVCNVQYATLSKAGTVTITANFGGDSLHASSFGSSTLTVSTPPQSTQSIPNSTPTSPPASQQNSLPTSNPTPQTAVTQPVSPSISTNVNQSSAVITANQTSIQKTPPATPNFMASAQSSDKIHLSWDASSGATSYHILRSNSALGPYFPVATSVTTNSFNDTGLLASTTYFYNLYAVSNGNSTLIGTVSATTQASTTQAPSYSTTPETYNIPSWVKNNAKWWSQGTVSDSDFTQGIQYLIQQKIIVIPQTTAVSSLSTNQIPPWVKGVAGWWADGKISDSEFVRGIQFLIQAGVIKV